MKVLMAGLISLALLGCTPFGGFKSIPDTYLLYRKNGSSDFETQKALLECGYANPYSGVPDWSNDVGYEGYYEQEPLRRGCMLKDGFVDKLNNDSLCKHPNYRLTPACQPDAVIPTRSIERRLNSVFCKQYPRAQVCQPSGQEVVPQTEETAPPPKSFVPQSRSTEQANQLQRDIQKQNNRQMNNMLKSTAPKMKR